jgi:hypothetical protein
MADDSAVETMAGTTMECWANVLFNVMVDDEELSSLINLVSSEYMAPKERLDGNVVVIVVEVSPFLLVLVLLDGSYRGTKI